jgi:fumarate hydratase subunit alpha
MIRDIDVSTLRDTVSRLLVECNYNIPADVLQALRDAAAREESPLARRTLEQLIRNYEIAATERVPVGQDSGLAVVMLEVGQDVHWVGGSLQEAIYDGIREGTRSGYLRWSVTGDPTRLLKTAGGDTPGVIHVDIVPGADVRITVASKGFGAENMSALKMFVPADGVAAIKQFVHETVDRAGANACPPIIVGVGVGGTFEVAALLAKKAVLRPVDVRHPRADLCELEGELLDQVNGLGIGAQGLGGIVTALAVNVEVFPTHIAGLPVAVSSRSTEAAERPALAGRARVVQSDRVVMSGTLIPTVEERLPSIQGVRPFAAGSVPAKPWGSVRRKCHTILARVTDAFEARTFTFNTSIAGIMELVNTLREAGIPEDPVAKAVTREALETTVHMISPFAPHIAEELWRSLGHDGPTLFRVPWPEVDAKALEVDSVEIAIQVNGKVRARSTVAKGLSEEQVFALAGELDPIRSQTEGKQVVFKKWVPDKLLNIVVR